MNIVYLGFRVKILTLVNYPSAR